MKKLELIQGSKEWLQKRKEHFTSSDARNMFNKKYASVYHAKQGKEVFFGDKTILERGLAKEDEILERFKNTLTYFNNNLTVKGNVYLNDNNAYLTSLDAEGRVAGELIPIELKNPTNKHTLDIAGWTVQVQHQMATLGVATGYLAYLTEEEGDFKFLEIEANDELIRDLHHHYLAMMYDFDAFVLANGIASSDIIILEKYNKEVLKMLEKSSNPYELDLSVKAEVEVIGNFDKFEAWAEKLLKTPAPKIENAEQFVSYSELSKALSRTENGMAKGGIPALKQAIDSIKGKINILQRLESKAKDLTTWNNQLEKNLKYFKDNEFTLLADASWNTLMGSLPTLNTKVLLYFTKARFDNELAGLVKGKRTLDSKKTELDKLTHRWFNMFLLKNEELTELLAYANGFIDLIDLIDLGSDFLSNKKAIDTFKADKIAKEEALKIKWEADKVAKEKADLEAKECAEVDAKARQERANELNARVYGDMPSTIETSEPIANLNQRVIYYSDELNSSLNAVFSQFKNVPYRDGIKLEKK